MRATIACIKQLEYTLVYIIYNITKMDWFPNISSYLTNT